jgi:hypothetical protein
MKGKTSPQNPNVLRFSPRQRVGLGRGPNEALEEGTAAMGINDVGAPSA